MRHTSIQTGSNGRILTLAIALSVTGLGGCIGAEEAPAFYVDAVRLEPKAENDHRNFTLHMTFHNEEPESALITMHHMRLSVMHPNGTLKHGPRQADAVGDDGEFERQTAIPAGTRRNVTVEYTYPPEVDIQDGDLHQLSMTTHYHTSDRRVTWVYYSPCFDPSGSEVERWSGSCESYMTGEMDLRGSSS